jgi:hypothetical protein
MEYLPSRITKMIGLLHSRGFHDIYIYSGMSASGTSWRFIIGRIKNDIWPSQDLIAHGSVRADDDVEWNNRTSSIEELCENFIHFYKLKKAAVNNTNLEYVKWYARTQKMLKDNEPLVFYADYEAPHEYLLETAPGYKTKNS